MNVHSSTRNFGSYEFRFATPSDDLDRIALVVNAAYKKAKFLMGDRTTPQEIKNLISNSKKKIYLCISSTNEICGTILLDFFDKDKVELGLFSIHPDYQGAGIGPLFMKYVEEEAFKKANEIFMTVIPLLQGNLIKFYEKLGYASTGQKLEFPETDKEKILPEYRNTIYFTMMHKKKMRNSL